MSNTNDFRGFSKVVKDVGILHDTTFVKLYECGELKKVKLVLMKSVKNSLVEIETSNELRGKKGEINDSKLQCNISRTKQKIFELAFCNPWEYFFTGTLDKSKYNREDLEKFHKDFTQFIRDMNKKYELQIKYLVVPELHSDKKSWHLHGFILGLPKNMLSKFEIGQRMGKAIAEKVQHGEIVYNWEDYSSKFGFCDLEPIKNHEAVAKYITKYINKELANNVTELNAHQYYRSRDLQEAKTLKKGAIDWRSITPDYSNDYCKICWLSYDDYLKLI